MNILTYFNISIRYALITGISVLAMQKANAQEKIELTLKDAVSLAIKNNWEIQKAQQDVGIASAAYNQSKAIFLPNINLSETFITTTDPLMSFGLKLKQEIVTTQNFDPELLNNPTRIENYATVLKIEQPIFNPDGILAKKAAAKGKEAAEYNMSWTKSMTSFRVKTVYFNLKLGYEQQRTVLNALVAAKANGTVAKDLYEQNLINKADLLSAELRVTELESQVLSAENYLHNLNISLTHLLGLAHDTIIRPTDSVPLIIYAQNELQIGGISENRNDIKAIQLQMEASNLMLKSSKSTLIPKLNAFGSYELNDLNPFGNGANNYTVGAKLEWDIFKGGMNLGKIQKALHQKRLTEIIYKEKISNENRALEQIQNDIRLAIQKITLTEQASKQAEEVYSVRKDRFEQGMEKTSDVLQAESEMMNKKLENLQSINNYQQLVFRLEILLDKDLTSKI